MHLPGPLYHLARRRPDLVVIAAFAWGPAWLVGGLASGDQRIILACLTIAAAPFVLVMLWPFIVGIREGSARDRAIALGVLAAVIAFSLVIGPMPLPE